MGICYSIKNLKIKQKQNKYTQTSPNTLIHNNTQTILSGFQKFSLQSFDKNYDDNLISINNNIINNSKNIKRRTISFNDKVVFHNGRNSFFI